MLKSLGKLSLVCLASVNLILIVYGMVIPSYLAEDGMPLSGIIFILSTFVIDFFMICFCFRNWD